MGVWLLLWVTRGAHNPNLQVASVLAPQVCSYSLIWSSTENEWNASHAIWSHAFRPSITCDLITHVLTIYHVKLMQSTGFEQKCFDLPSLSPALRNLWLLLVYRQSFCLCEVSETNVMLSFDLLAIFTVKCNDSVSFSFLFPCFLFYSLRTK